MGDDLLGKFTVEKPALLRQLAMDSFEAASGGHPMTAFMELDVTVPLARIEVLRRQGARVSLFAHAVRSIAHAISEHPDLNVVRQGSRLVRFEDVDVNVPVEVDTADGRFPVQLVIRRAQDKSAMAIYREITDAKRRHEGAGFAGDEDRWARRMMQLARPIPRWLRVRLIRRMIASAKLVKRRSGTTLVTSVGKFASVPGFVMPLFAGPRAVVFAVGSVVEKPVVRGGKITVGAVLSLTAIFDHDLVDGAPAARFATRLKELVEGVEGLPDEPAVERARDSP